MKKRILYIILGLMLFANVGVGQSFTLSGNSYSVSSSPINFNCASVTFDCNNNTSSSVDFTVYKSATGLPGSFSIIFSNTVSPNNISQLTFYDLGTIYYYAEINSSTIITSSTYQVEIRNKPIRPTITSNTPICEGADLTFNTANVSGGTFSWTGVNGFSSSLQNPTIINATTAANGSYSATVTVNGCTSATSSILTATVNQRPTALLTNLNTSICTGNNINITGSLVATGIWTLTYKNSSSSITSTTSISGNGNASLQYDVSPTENTVYTILSLEDSKCTATSLSGTASITVNPIPSAPTIISNTPICEGAALTFNTANVSGGTFSWTGVNGFSSSLQNPTITTATTAASGNYGATVTVLGCTSPSSTISATVNSIPSAPIITSNTPICEGATLTFSSANVSGGTFSWTGVNGFSSSMQNPTRTTATTAMTGNYSATVTVLGCTSPSSTISATVNPIPSAPTISSNTPICDGVTLTFNTANVSGGTFSWTGVNGFSSSLQNPTITTATTAASGNYGATVTVLGCTSPSSTISATVNSIPSAPIITSNTPICEGATLTFSSANVSGGTFSWTGVNGFSSSLQNPTRTTATTAMTGNYSATVTVLGCTSPSSIISVTVNPLPAKPSLTNQTICEGLTATITGPTGVYTYTWTVPTGVATSTTNTVSTTKAGTYSLTITDANTCTSEVGTATVTVNPLPAKPTLTSQTICEGATATITGPTGTYTYTWQVPTGVATSTTKSVITSKAGTYSLTITDANTCTSEVGTATVSVNPLPAKPTLTSQTICEGATATITGPTGTYTYTWQVPSGVATSTSNSVTTTKAGTYSLTITDANTCTSEVGTGTVIVNALPPKPTLTSPVICDGANATVTMSAPTGTNTYTYTWQVPSGVATSTSNSVTTTKAGTYSLTITDANTCTSEVGTGTVTVNPLPTLTITNPAAVCAPGTVDLTATNITAGSTSSLTYTYFTNASATTSLANANTISTTGSYYIKGTTALNCSDIKAVNATIHPIPTFTISSPSVCLGATLTITANPLSGAKSDYNYIWQVPNGAPIPGNVSSFSATTAGVYTATIKNKITNCESAAVNNNAVFHPLPIPKAIVASDNKVIENKTLNLTAAASGGTSPYTFTWTPSSTMYYSISGQENAVFNAIKEGKVNIKYQVKDVNNCEANSGDYEITINKAAITGSPFPFAVPNAFTPNGDGKNDKFKIIFNNTTGVTLRLQIYNRNGILMFSTSDISKEWDGRYKDVMQDMGIYFVKYRIEIAGGKIYEDTPRLYLLK